MGNVKRVLVLSAAAALALMACSDDPDDASTASSPSTDVGTDATAGDDDVAVEEATWSRVADEESIEHIGSFDIAGELSDVAVTDNGYVAVGAAEGNAAVWTSADGVRWRRATQVPDTDPRGFSGGIALTDEGDLAVTARGAFGAGEVAVWSSPDGRNWNEVARGPDVFGDDANVADVTRGGPGWVAVGTSRDENAQTVSAVVWTATDETSWTRVPHDDDIFGGATMIGVIAGPPGLLAFGGSTGDPAAWTSTDGRSWVRVPFDQADFTDAMPLAVSAGGPGWVAVGGTAEGEPAAWTSPDGTTWTAADPFVGGPAEPLVAVTASGSQLVAVGEGTSLWTSPDGTTWTNVPHAAPADADEERAIRTLVADGTDVVVVGAAVEESGEPRPAVWLITLPE
jgi:hypothetical protein